MLKISRKASCGLEKAMRSDRKWFARNPSRTYRARPFVADELVEGIDRQVNAGQSRSTLVCQTEAGFRVRTFIHTPNFAAPLNTDEALEALFDGALRAEGFMWVPLEYFCPTGIVGASAGLLEHTSEGVQ